MMMKTSEEGAFYLILLASCFTQLEYIYTLFYEALNTIWTLIINKDQKNNTSIFSHIKDNRITKIKV